MRTSVSDSKVSDRQSRAVGDVGGGRISSGAHNALAICLFVWCKVMTHAHKLAVPSLLTPGAAAGCRD